MTDFIITSYNSRHHTGYLVYYKPNNLFCKRLDHVFTSRKHAYSVAMFLQLWLCHDGQILYTGLPDCKGTITSIGGNANLFDINLLSAYFYLFNQGGFCPIKIASSLLDYSERKIIQMISKHGLSCISAGKIRLVNISELVGLMKKSECLFNMKQLIKKASNRLELLQSEYEKLKPLIPVLESLYIAIKENLPETRNKDILLGYLNGYTYNELSAINAVSAERIRQIVKDEMVSLNKLITNLTVVYFTSLQTQLVNIRLNKQIQQLLVEAKMVKLTSIFNVYNVNVERAWVKELCRLSKLPIGQLGFTVRALHVLQDMGMKTILDLLKVEDMGVGHVKNAGKKTVDEILSFYKEKNLQLLKNPIVLAQVTKMIECLAAEQIETTIQPCIYIDGDYMIWAERGEDVENVLKNYNENGTLNNKEKGNSFLVCFG